LGVSNALSDGDVGVDVDDEIVSLDLDGVDLEAVESDLVAGCGCGAGERLAKEVGGVDFHAGRNLVREKGLEDEVELLMVADAVDAGVAESDGLTVSIGSERDFGRQSDGDSDAGSADLLAQFGMGLESDNNAGFALVRYEVEFGVLGVGKAGRLGVSFDVVAAICTAKKLLLEGAFEGIAADMQFYSGALGQGGT
jgi:hypothetical protein